MSEIRTESTPVVEERAVQGSSVRELRHDLRHSLYVLGLAMELLEDSGDHGQRFSEVVQMARKEQAAIERLVDRLLQLVPDTQDGTD